jgi:MFS family permease
MNTAKLTKWVLFCSNVLQEPFVVLNLMLDIILSSHFGASALQISLLTTLRPILAVFAFYWGSILLFKPHFLKMSLVGATALGSLLFLFAPWADSIWFFIVAECFFILFWRAANPAQMEILKINLEKGERERVFSKALSLSYASGIIIGPMLGLFLKYHPDLWKELFCAVALLYSASALVKNYFPTPDQPAARAFKEISSAKEALIRPWKESWRLLKTNRAFLQFQLGFFIAGSGLMFAKPTIPGFLTGMQLSFFEIFSLFTLLEGIGFILTSSLWAKYLQKSGLQAASSLVLLAFSLQPLFLICASQMTICVFAAYFIYGAAQAGSRLVWNLSGPLLCGNESSSLYSSVNILAIGIRGCFVPLLGAACSLFFGPHVTLFISFACMLTGAFYLFRTRSRLVEI